MTRSPGMHATSRARWYVKKLARGGFALGGSTCSRLTRRSAPARVHVLTYHHIGEAPRDPFSVGLADFDAQMNWLADRGLAVSLADVLAYHGGTRPLADGSVLVTIDDGLRSLRSCALDVLQRRRIPAVAFVPAGQVAASCDDAARGHLSWSELREVAAAGVTIGSHAWSHRSLGRLAAADVRAELVDSRAALEDRLGTAVSTLAYPFGTRADFNDTVAALCREAGYACAFTSQHGPIRPGTDPFTLPRIKVEGGESVWMFGLLCTGALDGWGWVDRTLWRLQDRG